MTELKQVIVMRKDLGMRKGKMIAQGAHASVLVVTKNMKDRRVVRWLQGHQTKIVVGADSGARLVGVYHDAERAGLLCHLVRDAGHTEVAPGTITCCAIGPGPADEIDKITGELPLL